MLVIFLVTCLLWISQSKVSGNGLGGLAKELVKGYATRGTLEYMCYKEFSNVDEDCEVRWWGDHSEMTTMEKVVVSIEELDPTGTIAPVVQMVDLAFSWDDKVKICEKRGGKYHREVSCGEGFKKFTLVLDDNGKVLENCNHCEPEPCDYPYSKSTSCDKNEKLEIGFKSGNDYCYRCVGSSVGCGGGNWFFKGDKTCDDDPKTAFECTEKFETVTMYINDKKVHHQKKHTCCKCSGSCQEGFHSVPVGEKGSFESSCYDNGKTMISNPSKIDGQICLSCTSPCGEEYRLVAYGTSLGCYGTEQEYCQEKNFGKCCKCLSLCSSAKRIFNTNSVQMYRNLREAYQNAPLGYFARCAPADSMYCYLNPLECLDRERKQCCTFIKDQCPSKFGDGYYVQNSDAHYTSRNRLEDRVTYRTQYPNTPSVTDSNGFVQDYWLDIEWSVRCYNAEGVTEFYNPQLDKTFKCCSAGFECDQNEYPGYTHTVNLDNCGDYKYSGWDLHEIERDISDPRSYFMGFGLGCRKCKKNYYCPDEKYLGWKIMFKERFITDPLEKPWKQVKFEFPYKPVLAIPTVKSEGGPCVGTGLGEEPYGNGKKFHCLRHENGILRKSGDHACCRCDAIECPCEERECLVYEVPVFKSYRWVGDEEKQKQKWSSCDCCKIDRRPCPVDSSTEDLTCDTSEPYYFTSLNWQGRYTNKQSCNKCQLTCPPGFDILWGGSKELYGKYNLEWERGKVGDCSNYQYMNILLPGLKYWCCKTIIVEEEEEKVDKITSAEYDEFFEDGKYFTGKVHLWEKSLDCYTLCYENSNGDYDENVKKKNCALECRDRYHDEFLNYCVEEIEHDLKESGCRANGMLYFFEMLQCYDNLNDIMDKSCEIDVRVTHYVSEVIGLTFSN